MCTTIQVILTCEKQRKENGHKLDTNCLKINGRVEDKVIKSTGCSFRRLISQHPHQAAHEGLTGSDRQSAMLQGTLAKAKLVSQDCCPSSQLRKKN